LEKKGKSIPEVFSGPWGKSHTGRREGNKKQKRGKKSTKETFFALTLNLYACKRKVTGEKKLKKGRQNERNVSRGQVAKNGRGA